MRQLNVHYSFTGSGKVQTSYWYVTEHRRSAEMQDGGGGSGHQVTELCPQKVLCANHK